MSSTADIMVKVHGRDATDLGQKIAAIDALARTPAAVADLPIDVPGVDPPDDPTLDPPVLVAPYFDIGDAAGKAGDVVELSVEAGCRFKTNGFHVVGGAGLLADVPQSGYGKFRAIGVSLGSFLTAYFKSQGLIVNTEDEALPPKWADQYWSLFHFINHAPQQDPPQHPFPEEWWEYHVGFFSINQEKYAPPIQIPSGTELFRLKIQILEGTDPGEYEVTCKNEHYWTHERPRRRELMFNTASDSPFARGGITKLELLGGKITVIE